jgi:hypothetical protein
LDFLFLHRSQALFPLVSSGWGGIDWLCQLEVRGEVATNLVTYFFFGTGLGIDAIESDSSTPWQLA